MLLSPKIPSTRTDAQALALPVIRPSTTATELTGDGDDSDSSYVKVPEPSFPQSPGHRFPPQRFRTVERSPLMWNEIPATFPAVSNRPERASAQNSHAGPSRTSPQDRDTATSLVAVSNVPTQPQPASPTHVNVHRDPVPPPSAVISLADAIPSLRRPDSNNHSPRYAGSPVSHSSGSSTVIPAACMPKPPQSSERTIRLPEPASPSPLIMARESPSSTQPASPRRSPNQLASPIRSPPRQLRSPRAEAIWAAIVDPPPDPPSFSHSDLKPTPAPAPPKPKPAPAPTQSPTPTLPPHDPIYLLRFQPMNLIWNTLPTGTFWEFARYALREKIDFTRLNDETLIPSLIGRPNEPKKSNVQGVEEIHAWEEGSLDAKLSPEDIRWVQELDWEAEAMVEGKGRMLGIGVDGDLGDKYGTRYGGRVGFCALLKCEGNDGPLNLDINARITLDKPMMRGSCLFTRVWGSHRFLRLKLSKPLLNRVSRDQSGRLVKELKKFCARPIHILGREYHPLVEKENTVYYFLHGRDRIGLKAVEDAGGDRKQPYGLGRHIGTVEGLVQWWLAPEHNRNQMMSKLTTRLHLGLSDTLPGVFIKPENVRIIPDIGTFHRQYSIQVLAALTITLQNVMALLSPTEQGWNRVLLQEHVGENFTRTIIRHHPLPRFVLAARKESSKSTRKTSKQLISKGRTRSLLPTLWPKSSMARASFPGVQSMV
jgi:hypothetical protein